MPFDNELVNEQNHVDVLTNGFFDATGTSLRYGGTFGAEMPTDTYNESLLRSHQNASDAGMIALCIAYFLDNPISHTQGNTGFTAAGTIELNVISDLTEV